MEEATMLLDPPIAEREHPSAPTMINDRLLMFTFKVMPCQLHACKGPDSCVYLHPGEKGRRRDPVQSSYALIPCPNYRRNCGACPDGDRCRFAHGLLELRFHPSAYFYARRLEFKDLEVYLTGDKLLPDERAAIQLILDLKSNGCIRGYKLLRNDTEGAIDEEIDDKKARARFAGKVIFKKYGYGNAFTLNNTGQLSSSSGASSKLPEEDGVSVTSIDEWVEPPWIADLLSDVDASPTAGGSIVPTDDPMQAWVDPDFFLDSGASRHVVGVEITLHNYRLLPEPLSVTVADGYELRVLGIGSIISQCGNFSIHNVHRVEGIQMNLVSVAQLDIEYNLFCGFQNRRCELKNHDDRIGGGHMVGDGLYRLSFLQVPET